ncbi:hypothetical protein V9T40_000271 [Parthenolecanium corni]|uniref:Uncharacterized protein n=1 Tax=Parthenolecanium corni TaxID=536013 RepID=A0AAN9Y0B0_9HEMI
MARAFRIATELRCGDDKDVDVDDSKVGPSAASCDCSLPALPFCHLGSSLQRLRYVALRCDDASLRRSVARADAGLHFAYTRFRSPRASPHHAILRLTTVVRSDKPSRCLARAPSPCRRPAVGACVRALRRSSCSVDKRRTTAPVQLRYAATFRPNFRAIFAAFILISLVLDPPPLPKAPITLYVCTISRSVFARRDPNYTDVSATLTPQLLFRLPNFVHM